MLGSMFWFEINKARETKKEENIFFLSFFIEYFARPFP